MEKANYKDFLGKKVHIVMDRPMGVKHPKWNFIYPLNYGYVPNTISGDGAELDAYIIGVFEPLEEYEGKLRLLERQEKDREILRQVQQLLKSLPENMQSIPALCEARQQLSMLLEVAHDI